MTSSIIAGAPQAPGLLDNRRPAQRIARRDALRPPDGFDQRGGNVRPVAAAVSAAPGAPGAARPSEGDRLFVAMLYAAESTATAALLGVGVLSGAFPIVVAAVLGCCALGTALGVRALYYQGLPPENRAFAIIVTGAAYITLSTLMAVGVLAPSVWAIFGTMICADIFARAMYQTSKHVGAR